MSKTHASGTARHTSRRDFLKTSTLAAGAAMAGTLAVGRSAHAAGSDVIKVGLVGCGGRGTGAAANAMNADPNVHITAMADAFEDRLQGSLNGLKKREPERVKVAPETSFVGFDAYQKLIDSGVDVVILATTPHFRPQHLKACVAAGKHVFCEKPVAVDAPGIRSVLQTTEEAKKKNVNIVSGLCWRYDQRVRDTMQRAIDGQIGDIIAIQETYNTNALWKRDRQPDQTEMQYQMRNWYNFSWLSGDHNVEQHVHSLDKGSWLMGDKPPAAVWGLGGRQVDYGPKHGNIFDHHAVVYEYDNGVRMYSYCRQQSDCWNSTEDYFFGTKGICNVLNGYWIKGEKPWQFPDRRYSIRMYDAEHEALFKAIRAGETINNGQYMALSTMLAIAGRMVNYTGKRLTWDQVMNSQETLSPAEYTWEADPPVMPNADGTYPVAQPGRTLFV